MRRSALFMACAGLSAVSWVLGCVLAVVAWQRSGLPYNEEGQSFDGLVNVHEQSVLGYSLVALAALVLSGALAWVARRVWRR